MKGRNLVITILLGTLGVVLLIYFILEERNEKRYQWHESYRADSNQPYGTMFIKKLLEKYRPDQKFIFNDDMPLEKLLDSAASTHSTDYIFIGNSLYLSEPDKDALLHFIYSGNDALIATNNLPFEVIDPIFEYDCDAEIYLEEYRLDSAQMNFYNNKLRAKDGYVFSYRRGKKDRPYRWHTLNEEVFCDSLKSILPLGYVQQDLVNFFKLPYGTGNLYIHTNPLVFTNYFLIAPDKADYSARVFSHLKGKSVIWDEFSRLPFEGNNDPYNSPLSFVMQHNSLKYAWWMMLGSALLYTVFTAKRKQRVIPVLEKKTNTSLEFVKMISALYFENGNHLDIARKKMKYFQHFIRVKYGIHAHQPTDSQILRLAEKSSVKAEEIRAIFTEFNTIEKGVHIDTRKVLMDLYRAIENFYKHCK